MSEVAELKTELTKERERCTNLMIEKLQANSWLWYWKNKFEMLEQKSTETLYGVS